MQSASTAVVLCVLTFLGSVFWADAGTARGCVLDQRPSVTANGRLARFNTRVPTTARELAAFTLFYFDHAYRAHQVINLNEDRREVAASLTPAAMQRPWRWSLGDGTTAFGWSVRHAYARAGVWRILVDAYDPGTQRWYNFDQVAISVTSR